MPCLIIEHQAQKFTSAFPKKLRTYTLFSNRVRSCVEDEAALLSRGGHHGFGRADGYNRLTEVSKYRNAVYNAALISIIPACIRV